MLDCNGYLMVNWWFGLVVSGILAVPLSNKALHRLHTEHQPKTQFLPLGTGG